MGNVVGPAESNRQIPLPARRRPLPTWKEREILRFVARQQATTISQIAARVGHSKRYLYSRLANFVDLGLLTHTNVLHAEEGVYRPTRRGLKAAGQSQRSMPELTLGKYHHRVDLTWLCIELEREFGEGRVLTARELRSFVEDRACPRFTVRTARRSGPSVRHFPDLAVDRFDGERALCVQLEDGRPSHAVVPLMRAYLRAGHIAGVRFYAQTPAVERELTARLARLAPPPGLFEVRRWSRPERQRAPKRKAPGDRGAGAPAKPPWGRRSGGRRQLTRRDIEIVRWVGRQRMATVLHVAAHIGFAVSSANLRLGILVERGLVSYDRVLHGQHGVYRATTKGLALGGEIKNPWRIELASYLHDLALTTLCLVLEREFGAERVVTERELRQSDRIAPRPHFTMHLDALGRKRHFPDLAVDRFDGDRPLAVELERSPKLPSELDAILRGYVRARHLAAVRYYTPSAAVEQRLAANLARIGPPEGFFEVRRWPEDGHDPRSVPDLR